MIGYTDRDTRCSGSRHRLECCSTPAPRPGYMFSIAPIHMPIIPVRMSPKYFQVSESGPSGSAPGRGAARTAGTGDGPVLVDVVEGVLMTGLLPVLPPR